MDHQITKMNKYSDILKAFSDYVIGSNGRHVDGTVFLDIEQGLDDDVEEQATDHIDLIRKQQKFAHKTEIIDCYSYKYCNICKRDKPPRTHH